MIERRGKRKEEYLEKAQEIARRHWEYIERLLRIHGEDEVVIRKCGFHYQTAFVHGAKHALELMEAEE